MTFLARLDNGLARFESLLMIGMFTIAFGLGVMQVVLRYVFNAGFHWNEAIFVLFTLTAVLVGGSRAVRDGIHARVEIITDLLPEKGVHVLNLFALLSSALLCGLYTYCGYLYTKFVHSMGLIGMETGIPEAIAFSIVPFTMFLFSVRYVIKMIEWRSDPGAYSRMTEIEHSEATDGRGGE